MKRQYVENEKINKNKWYLFFEDFGIAEVGDSKNDFKYIITDNWHKVDSGVYENEDKTLYRGDQLIECVL